MSYYWILRLVKIQMKHSLILQETENLLKQEAKVSDDDLKTEDDKKTEVSQALAAVYKRYVSLLYLDRYILGFIVDV